MKFTYNSALNIVLSGLKISTLTVAMVAIVACGSGGKKNDNKSGDKKDDTLPTIEGIDFHIQPTLLSPTDSSTPSKCIVTSNGATVLDPAISGNSMYISSSHPSDMMMDSPELKKAILAKQTLGFDCTSGTDEYVGTVPASLIEEALKHIEGGTLNLDLKLNKK